MEAIVLVGGLGTRLRTAVSDVPKPMAPVQGRPFVAFVLDRLAEAGFAHVVLAAGYQHEALRAHFGEQYRGMPVTYSVESEPLGTGGAIHLALGCVGSPDAFVLNGDTYLEVDLRAMLAAHEAAAAVLTIAVCRIQDAARYGALEFDGGLVRRFTEKGSAGPGWINGGTYIVGTGLRASFPAARAFSFEDFLAREVSTLRPLAFRASGRFIDIGTPDDYAHAQALLRL